MKTLVGFGLLAIVVHVQILISPFTKVEESFNIQACHDLLYHRGNIDAYDHKEFPGVVPRTFTGPIILSLLATPFSYLSTHLGHSKLVSLVIIRLVTAWLCLASFATLSSTIYQVFGDTTAFLFLLLTSTQFHTPFYASRTFANTFAMIITNVAFSYWISLLRKTEKKKEEKRRGAMMTLILLTTATVVFRCDVILLLACTSLHLLLTRHITIPQIILTCIATAGVCLATTVPVDSFFWDKWLWPEGQVLWFNTVMNKSKEWGLMPWQWYLVSALPRALTISYILAPFGALFLDTRVRPAFVVALGYVLLYSNLGHKEVRFLFPVLPLFTLCAAAALQALIHRSFCSITDKEKKRKRKKKKKKRMSRWLFRLILLVSIGGIAAGSIFTVIGTIASKYNYPGGVAFLSLHTLLKGEGGGGGGNNRGNNNIVKVHINVVPAMTGVTRFGEQQHSNGCYYSKKESSSDSSSELLESGFNYLLSGDRRVEGYEVVEVVDGFDSVQVERGGRGGKWWWWWPVVKVVTKPSVYIHKKKRLEGE